MTTDRQRLEALRDELMMRHNEHNQDRESSTTDYTRGLSVGYMLAYAIAVDKIDRLLSESSEKAEAPEPCLACGRNEPYCDCDPKLCPECGRPACHCEQE